jgi:hyperosmotically inducible protein
MAKRLRTAAILGAALLAAQSGFAGGHKSEAGVDRIEREARRAIVMLPFYSLFDRFTIRVDGETVTLMGKVNRPALKSDAGNVVKAIEGVEKVNNEIEIPPLSPNDGRLRLALYQAVYGHIALPKLAIRAVPPIHIIVENGNVTLEGVVANEMQKNIAANGVSGVFSVTNNLRVESRS